MKKIASPGKKPEKMQPGRPQVTPPAELQMTGNALNAAG
jgi:hypothetical protein